MEINKKSFIVYKITNNTNNKELKYTHFKDVRELREEKLNQLGI